YGLAALHLTVRQVPTVKCVLHRSFFPDRTSQKKSDRSQETTHQQTQGRITLSLGIGKSSMSSRLSSTLIELQAAAERITEQQIAPRAREVDENCLWPAHSMRALAQEGLLGLHVPQSLGGLGQGLLALSVLTETIGKACPSSALCFGMHCVGTAVIAAKATGYQRERYLKPIARGE